MSHSVDVPGYRSYGWGRAKIIALHDWLSDTSSYEPMLPYLDPDLCQWVFMDLRGYGLSRGFPADYTLAEAARDVLALADHLNWQSFHLIGHSMSGMIVQKVAALAPERLNGLIAVTPVSASGQPLTVSQKADLRAMAHERTCGEILRSMWGGRLSESWLQYKLRRWRETADGDASAAYVSMFAGPGFTSEVAGFAKPVLVIAGGHDSGPFEESSLRLAFVPLYQNLTVTTLASSGHYPMQEVPVFLATLMERFVLETFNAARMAEGMVSGVGIPQDPPL